MNTNEQKMKHLFFAFCAIAAAIALTGCANSSLERKVTESAEEIAFLRDQRDRYEIYNRKVEADLRGLLSRLASLSDDVLASCGLYRVRQSDTLQLIAKRHGQTVRNLALWNHIADPTNLSAWDVLIVSEKGLEQRHDVEPSNHLAQPPIPPKNDH